MLRLISFLTVLLLAPLAQADVLSVKPDSPKTYVVVKGDTLWDISAKFLRSPWRWPELWGFNKQIADPHWIYPGDRLSLIYVDGKPRLIINQAKPKIVMTRHGRKHDKGQAIPTISLESIERFLTHALVVDESTLKDAAILVGSERNAVYYQKSDIIFANKALDSAFKYGIYKKGRTFTSPETKKYLGLELEMVGRAEVVVSASISRLEITSVDSGIQNGLVILPITDTFPRHFMPSAAPKHIHSSVMGSAAKFLESGKNNVVIIDGGTAQNIKVGHVFSIYQPGKIQFIDKEGQVRDPFSYRAYDNVKAYFIDNDTQRLPNVYRGDLMVFKSFENLSYALITNTIRPVRTGDDLINP